MCKHSTTTHTSRMIWRDANRFLCVQLDALGREQLINLPPLKPNQPHSQLNTIFILKKNLALPTPAMCVVHHEARDFDFIHQPHIFIITLRAPTWLCCIKTRAKCCQTMEKMQFYLMRCSESELPSFYQQHWMRLNGQNCWQVHGTRMEWLLHRVRDLVWCETYSVWE